MASVAQEAKKMLAKLPKNATWEDLQYQIFVHQKAEEGMKAYREGRVVSQVEAEKRVKRWLGK